MGGWGEDEDSESVNIPGTRCLLLPPRLHHRFWGVRQAPVCQGQVL